MGWAETKRQMQTTVQDTFGLLAEYVGPNSQHWMLTKVRVHTKVFRQGDADSIGYVEHFDEGVRLAFLDPSIQVVKGGRVTMPTGEVYVTVFETEVNQAGVRFWEAKLDV